MIGAMSPKCRYTFLFFLFGSLLPGQQKTRIPGEFVQWLPITDAERQQKAPLVDKDAGVEALMWRVHVVDEFVGQDIQRASYNYVRLKVFNEKGKEQVSTIDLTYGSNGNILNIAARTIKADGTIVELPKDAVHRRDVVRANGFKRKAVSFTLPAVEPGAILEYRWRAVLDDNRIMYTTLNFEREFPIQRITYFVMPLDSFRTGYETFLMPFNCKPSPINREPDGFTSTFVENVAAARDEPWAASTQSESPWALLYYSQGQRKNADKFWTELGKEENNKLKLSLKADDALKAAAAEATASAKGEEEKVAGLIAYLRQYLRDINASDVTEAERTRIFKSMPKDRHRTAAEVFKSGIGFANEMNVVFAAMATQAGLDARPALVSNHDLPFNPKFTTERYFLDNIDMAVKTGAGWKVYDVSRKLLPAGMLSWREEGQQALVTDPKNPVFVETPLSAPEDSVERRTAKLELSADGEMEGDVVQTLSGHKAEEYRGAAHDKPAAEREDDLKEELNRFFPRASVTAIKILNVDDFSKPIEIRYHLQTAFAQVTGRRILFEPNVFRRAIASPFSASVRRRSIDFRYAWSEVDDITMQLPHGYELENAENPGSINFGKTGSYEMKMTVNKSTNEMHTVRQLRFGAGGVSSFFAKDYAPVKKVFDDVHARDRQTMVLRETK